MVTKISASESVVTGKAKFMVNEPGLMPFQNWIVVDSAATVECQLVAALRPTTVLNARLGRALHAKGMTRP